MFTDNSYTKQDQDSELSTLNIKIPTPCSELCKVCNIQKWSEIKHCDSCGICTKMYHNHCVTFCVCVNYKNYKFSICALLYCIISCVALNYSMITVYENFKDDDEKLKK